MIPGASPALWRWIAPSPYSRALIAETKKQGLDLNHAEKTASHKKCEAMKYIYPGFNLIGTIVLLALAMHNQVGEIERSPTTRLSASPMLGTETKIESRRYRSGGELPLASKQKTKPAAEAKQRVAISRPWPQSGRIA